LGCRAPSGGTGTSTKGSAGRGACWLLGQRRKAGNRWSSAGSCWRRKRWSREVPPRSVPSQGRTIRLLVTGGAPLPPRPPGGGTEYPLPPLASIVITCLSDGNTKSRGCRRGEPTWRAGTYGPGCWRKTSRERGAAVGDRRRPRPRSLWLGRWRGRHGGPPKVDPVGRRGTRGEQPPSATTYPHLLFMLPC